VTNLPQPCSVLVVDDEPAWRKAICTSLAANGFDVAEAGTGSEAVGAFQQRLFDLVLLDVNMPGMDGLEACRQIREFAPRTGIVMVTVLDDEEDVVQALEAGADDYVTKPFRFGELMAHLRAVLRRTCTDISQKPPVLVNRRAGVGKEGSTMELGELKMDLESGQLWKAGKEIRLSPTEFEFLLFLMKNQGVVLTYEKILRAVWDREYDGENEYIRNYVRMLRKKIEDDPARPQYIQTERPVGYWLRNPSAPNPPAILAEDVED
jgi:two-component system KDP operon response regulator KdpE